MSNGLPFDANYSTRGEAKHGGLGGAKTHSENLMQCLTR